MNVPHRDLPRIVIIGCDFGGWFAWLMWMFVHLMLLVDFRSRLVVFVNWAWSYLFYDKGTRLIVRKAKDKKVVDCKEEEEIAV